MAGKRITQYPKTAAPTTEDFVILDGPQGTRAIKMTDLVEYIKKEVKK